MSISPIQLLVVYFLTIALSSISASSTATLIDDEHQDSHQHLDQATAGTDQLEDKCSLENIHTAIKEAKLQDRPLDEEAKKLYDLCSAKFLDENSIKPLVKETVDDWLGIDLSQAEASELFIAYQLAQVSPRPEVISSEFTRDCQIMINSYELFRNSITPLTENVEIDMSSLLANDKSSSSGPNQRSSVSTTERDLFNFAQYVQFCQSILSN